MTDHHHHPTPSALLVTVATAVLDLILSVLDTHFTSLSNLVASLKYIVVLILPSDSPSLCDVEGVLQFHCYIRLSTKRATLYANGIHTVDESHHSHPFLAFHRRPSRIPAHVLSPNATTHATSVMRRLEA